MEKKLFLERLGDQYSLIISLIHDVELDERKLDYCLDLKDAFETVLRYYMTAEEYDEFMANQMLTLIDKGETKRAS